MLLQTRGTKTESAPALAIYVLFLLWDRLTSKQAHPPPRPQQWPLHWSGCPELSVTVCLAKKDSTQREATHQLFHMCVLSHVQDLSLLHSLCISFPTCEAQIKAAGKEFLCSRHASLVMAIETDAGIVCPDRAWLSLKSHWTS